MIEFRLVHRFNSPTWIRFPFKARKGEGQYFECNNFCLRWGIPSEDVLVDKILGTGK